MMIPHHAGAVEMCEILRAHAHLDTYLDALCVNVTRVQRAEISWMSQWLNARGFSTIAPCQEDCPAGQVFAPQPALPCEDLLSTSSYCHWNGEATGDPKYCTCEGMTKSP